MGKAKVIPMVAYETEYFWGGWLGSEDMPSYAVGTVVFSFDNADPKRLLETNGEFRGSS